MTIKLQAFVFLNLRTDHFSPTENDDFKRHCLWLKLKLIKLLTTRDIKILNAELILEKTRFLEPNLEKNTNDNDSKTYLY